MTHHTFYNELRVVTSRLFRNSKHSAQPISQFIHIPMQHFTCLVNIAPDTQDTPTNWNFVKQLDDDGSTTQLEEHFVPDT